MMWIVNLAGLVLIALIIWWFWLYRPREVALQPGALTIVVDNGIYQPARIKLRAQQACQLQFLRKDASPCAETVVFPELDISASLPLNSPRQISLPPLDKGHYQFHCQMQMYRGELHVE